jgi:hypothetical protein
MLTTREQLEAIRREIASLIWPQVWGKRILHQPHHAGTHPVQSDVALRANRISALHNWSLELRGKAPQHGALEVEDVERMKYAFKKDAEARLIVEFAEADARRRARGVVFEPLEPLPVWTTQLDHA